MTASKKKSMPPIVIIGLAIIFFTNNADAQKMPAIDSLLHIYHTVKSHDTVFVKLLQNLSKEFRLSKPDTAIAFGNESLQLSDKLSYDKGIAVAMNLIGTAYFYKGDYPKAQNYQQKALAYSQQHHFVPLTTNALNSLALAFQYQGNYFAALDSYLKALAFEEASKNYYGQVKVLFNIGLLWKRQGNYDNSIIYTQKALALSDSIKDARSVKASLYNNLGLIFIEQKKFNEALKYLQQALDLNKELQNKIFIANSLGNLGYCHLNMGQLSQAEIFLQQGLILSRKLNYNEGVEKDLLNLSEIYVKQRKTKQALVLSEESMALAKKYNNKENILLNYQGLAAAHHQLGQLDKAYAYLQQAFSLGDSLKNADNTSRIRDLQKSFELNQKQTEITLLEKDGAIKLAALKEEANLRYELFGLIGGLSILALLTYYGFSVKSSLSRKLQKQNDEILAQKALIERINTNLKGQALRAQMNPHFIFNSLNSIQYLILQKNFTHSFDYLSKFSLLLRKVMDNSEFQLIPLSEEIEILHLYLELESLRFEESFDYKIESSADSLSLKIPPLIVQPYIENAILHGLMPKKTNRKLSVCFSPQADSLLCEISDNGIGRAEALALSKRKNKSVISKGMNYTSQRLDVMSVISGGSYSVIISDLFEDGVVAGTKVTIHFAYA